MDEDHYRENQSNGIGGRIYKMWTEVKDFFTGKDNRTLLKSCYKNALKEVHMPKNINALL
jgi:hypothetical protein